jgi:hypothetical protein
VRDIFWKIILNLLKPSQENLYRDPTNTLTTTSTKTSTRAVYTNAKTHHVKNSWKNTKFSQKKVFIKRRKKHQIKRIPNDLK